jgi:hypothetical protein
VVCEATDGREDFETGLVLSEEELRAGLSRRQWMVGGGAPEGELHHLNRLSMGLIERELGKYRVESSDSE